MAKTLINHELLKRVASMSDDTPPEEAAKLLEQLAGVGDMMQADPSRMLLQATGLLTELLELDKKKAVVVMVALELISTATMRRAVSATLPSPDTMAKMKQLRDELREMRQDG